jgi:hypothetical protein
MLIFARQRTAEAYRTALCACLLGSEALLELGGVGIGSSRTQKRLSTRNAS